MKAKVTIEVIVDGLPPIDADKEEEYQDEVSQALLASANFWPSVNGVGWSQSTFKKVEFFDE